MQHNHNKDHHDRAAASNYIKVGGITLMKILASSEEQFKTNRKQLASLDQEKTSLISPQGNSTCGIDSYPKLMEAKDTTMGKKCWLLQMH